MYSPRGIQGTYLISRTVNGKPSWTNGNWAIWILPGNTNWIFGPLEHIGLERGFIHANNDYSGLTAIENKWKYWTGNDWKLAQNDISVTCNDDRGTYFKVNLVQEAFKYLTTFARLQVDGKLKKYKVYFLKYLIQVVIIKF